MKNREGMLRFVLLIYFGLGVIIILATTVLGALHDLSPQAIAGTFGFAAGLLGGVGSALATFNQATNGKSIVPTEQLGKIQNYHSHLAELIAALEATVHSSLAASGEGTLSPKTPPAARKDKR